MTTHKEALTLALEALENEKGANNPLDWHHDKAITAIEEALAQPEQEPDVYIPADALRQLKGTSLLILRSVPLYGYRGDGLTPLYTTPPKREPLTFEQVEDCFPEGSSVFEDPYGDKQTSPRWLHAFARAIEAAHNIQPDTGVEE